MRARMSVQVPKEIISCLRAVHYFTTTIYTLRRSPRAVSIKLLKAKLTTRGTLVEVVIIVGACLW